MGKALLPLELLSLLALDVSLHSPNPVKPPINPLLFPAPKYRQLPAPQSGAAIKLAPPGLHREPFLIHIPERPSTESQEHTYLAGPPQAHHILEKQKHVAALLAGVTWWGRGQSPLLRL